MAPEGRVDVNDAQLPELQESYSQAEQALCLEQKALRDANETLEQIQQEAVVWRQRVEELRHLRRRQDEASTADAQKMKTEAITRSQERESLNKLNAKVLELREKLAKQPDARQCAAEAVAEVEKSTQKRREETAMQREAKQEAIRIDMEAAQARLSMLADQKAERHQELCKWRRRLAVLRLGRAAASWKKQSRAEGIVRQSEEKLLRLRRQLSRKQGRLDEEVALQAMEQKRELEKEATAHRQQQEEREEELERLEDEVDALKERTAKAKELLRQHNALDEALGIWATDRCNEKQN
ncbi:unnamed protein product [Durusdinium trenchii]|uniref:Uncharacterized protein n=1 Tax=Durusdinium trenchii TaxID=1381693 RepID=A0ABP0I554_9DINO